MNKTYILQKDLPDGAKAGDEYELYPSYYNYYKNTGAAGKADKVMWFQDYVENSPEWFKEKEKVKPHIIAVTQMEGSFRFMINSSGLINVIISEDRLAEILIANGKGELTINKNT